MESLVKKMTTKNQIKQAYSFIANDYDNYMENTNHANTQRKIIQLLKEEITGEVIDVATGTGLIALEVAKRIPNSRATGSDISERMIVRARINGRKAGYYPSFLVDDIEESALSDSQFDTVVCCLGMLWFVDKDKALREMVRICKERGKIILIEEEGEPLRSRRPKLNKRLLSFFSKIEKLESPISLEEIEEKMEGLDYQLTRKVKSKIDQNHGFIGMVFENLSILTSLKKSLDRSFNFS